MTKGSIIVLGFALVIASLSCQNAAQVVNTEGVSASQATTTKAQLPQPWLGEFEFNHIAHIEVRKVPNSSSDEFYFRALPDGDLYYAHEVDKKLRKPRYGKNIFAVNFSAGPQVRVATQQEWESGSRIPTKSRLAFLNDRGEFAGQIEYRRKHYPKVGQHFGGAMLSPTGKWLAVFSYSGQESPSFFFFGGEVIFGDAFWQIYDTVTGRKVFDWDAKNVKKPGRFNGPIVWLEDRYFLFPEDDAAQTFIVVNLPPITPEANPAMVQFPSRRDAAGRPLPPAVRQEVWIPLIPLTKAQAEKLTAPYETEIKEVRVSQPPSPPELLLAISEETENRRTNMQGRDGAGDYHFKLLHTYYYAVSLDNPAQARFATKEEWDRGQTRRHGRAQSEPVGASGKARSPSWPNREFAKTGTTWGTPPLLNPGDWILIFSYTEDQQDPAQPGGNLFVDVYNRILGYKLMSTTLLYKFSPNESFKGAVSIEDGYILLPLNASLDSFAFWQLP